MKSAHGRFLGDAIFMAKETNVEKRMEQILDDTRTIPPAFARRGWVALLLCSLPVGYFVSAVQLAPAQTRTAAPVVQPPAKEQPLPVTPVQISPVQIAQARRDTGQQVPTPAAPAPVRDRAAVLSSIETPYQKWLDEDVRWIISDDEIRAFKRYQTDDERQAFIEQFWLRRDPTPNTNENEMKEEHYRRIAFANDRFTEKIPGWQTDRGATYIKYGPPDALDSHSATAVTYPYETWLYRFIEGMGTNVELEFVDLTMTGRYHLTHDPSEKIRQ